MLAKYCIGPIAFLVILGVAAGAENYMDYGDDAVEKTPAENIQELYRLLLQRKAMENAAFGGIPLEHLMIRKSQRSPSLRLRFGRSGPHSAGVLPRPVGAVAGFEENNN